MAVAVASGVVIDGTLRALAAGCATPRRDPAFPPHGAPLWILCLWAAFALTLTRSLAWLMRRPWLAALLGALGAPLAYASAAARVCGGRVRAARRHAPWQDSRSAGERHGGRSACFARAPGGRLPRRFSRRSRDAVGRGRDPVGAAPRSP